MTAQYLKAGLLGLCVHGIAAEQLGIEVDPDGLIEDRHEIVSSKLRVEGGELEISPLLSDYSTNIEILPLLSIFDSYNYLISFTDYTHGTFRNVTKIEVYSMAKDVLQYWAKWNPGPCKAVFVWYHAWILHVEYFLHCCVCIYIYIYGYLVHN